MIIFLYNLYVEDILLCLTSTNVFNESLPGYSNIKSKLYSLR